MKNKNWRIVPIMLAAVMAVSFVGCGKGKSDGVPTGGDYSYQADGQYTFQGIPEDQTLNDTSESDTDSTGRVYGNSGGSYGSGSSYNKGTGSYGGSYGGLGSANEYNPGNGGNGGVKVSDYYQVGNKTTTQMSYLSVLNIVKGVTKTYDEAIKMLNGMGIYPDDMIKKALKAYFDSLTKPTEVNKDELVSNIVGGIVGLLPTKAPETLPEVNE